MKDQLCNRGKTLKKNERWFPELNNPQNFVNMEDGTFNVVPRNHIRRNINITNKESGVLGCRMNHDLFPARDHSERARAVRHSRVTPAPEAGWWARRPARTRRHHACRLVLTSLWIPPPWRPLRSSPERTYTYDMLIPWSYVLLAAGDRRPGVSSAPRWPRHRPLSRTRMIAWPPRLDKCALLPDLRSPRPSVPLPTAAAFNLPLTPGS